MLTLKDIDNKILELTGRDKETRPFLCQGSPIDCEVFIIGHNPGVSTFFWDCWNQQNGCDKKKWIERYYQERVRSGKRRSPTREKTEILIRAMHPYPVLDTNICHKYSPNFDKKTKDKWGTKVCDYLLEIIGPKLIFVHGKYAVEYLEKLADKRLPKGKLISVKLFGKSTSIYTGYHLSRCWSYEEVQKVGQELLKWCEENHLSISK